MLRFLIVQSLRSLDPVNHPSRQRLVTKESHESWSSRNSGENPAITEVSEVVDQTRTPLEDPPEIIGDKLRCVRLDVAVFTVCLLVFVVDETAAFSFGSVGISVS